MRVAVLVDAAFFLQRYRSIVTGGKAHTGTVVAETLHKWACDHLRDDGAGRRPDRVADLYRIFVYDCAPFEGKLVNPVSGVEQDFANNGLAVFRREFHGRLPQLRKVALRLGHLSGVKNWKIKPAVARDIMKGKRTSDSLGPDDVILDVQQKGVDMRIGVDVASLAFKRQVDRIVLLAGDADFVPAAKLARREGIDFVLDSLHAHVNSSLYEHIDGLRSMAPAPISSPLGNRGQPSKGYASTEYRVSVRTNAGESATGSLTFREVLQTRGTGTHQPGHESGRGDRSDDGSGDAASDGDK